MLAIISDLHFCDGTATDHNVDEKAFDLALADVYQRAADLAKAGETKAHLDLVFLGDVFDFLRTERWFQTRDGQPVPVADRPWGSATALEDGTASAATLARAHEIFDDILTENAGALATLRGDSLAPPPNVEVRRLYFSGNHDRLFLLDDRLRARCLSALNATDTADASLASQGIHSHYLAMPEYGLLARHGHEWDDWNFERYNGSPPLHYNDDDYLLTPIGDPITTELAARLPYLLARNLVSSRLSKPEQDSVVARMQHIEDVRPLLASLQWVFYEAKRIHGTYEDEQKRIDVTEALNATVRTLAADFRELGYYQAWERKHHHTLHADSAASLAALLFTLSHLDFSSVDSVMQAISSFVPHKEPRDTCLDGSMKEDLKSVGDAGLRFVVYGHTHDPLQVALAASDTTSDVYLNSGTFRNTTFRTQDKLGFIGWDRISYLTFLTQQEMSTFGPSQRVGPSFNAWTGSRSR